MWVTKNQQNFDIKFHQDFVVSMQSNIFQGHNIGETQLSKEVEEHGTIHLNFDQYMYLSQGE